MSYLSKKQTVHILTFGKALFLFELTGIDNSVIDNSVSVDIFLNIVPRFIILLVCTGR